MQQIRTMKVIIFSVDIYTELPVRFVVGGTVGFVVGCPVGSSAGTVRAANARLVEYIALVLRELRLAN